MGGSSSTASSPAAGIASEELMCSICLGSFDCPTTLSCGHSFCLRCLENAWDAAGSYSCPQCRVTYEQKPHLSRNVALANLVEELNVGKKRALDTFCDSCLDGSVPAVRNCLTCDTSLCESHGKHHLQHQKFKDHELVELGVDMRDRKCEIHKERLQVFCTRDDSLACTICAIVGEHKGHEFSTVEDAHETRKKQVGEKTQAVEIKTKEAEESVRLMKTVCKNTQDPISKTKEYISGVFMSLRKVLDEDEREALDRVDVKGRELLTPIEENIAYHQREISELQAAAARLHTLEQERDSLKFLQGYLEEARRSVIREKSQPPVPASPDTTAIRSLERVVDRFLPFIRNEDRVSLGKVATEASTSPGEA